MWETHAQFLSAATEQMHMGNFTSWHGQMEVSEAERAAGTNKCHFQGCFVYKSRLAMSRMKEKLADIVGPAHAHHAHLEQMHGSHAQAIAYCKKPDTAVPDTFMSVGITVSTGSGGGALQALSRLIFEGGKVRDLVDADNSHLFVRHHKGMFSLEALKSTPYKGKRIVLVFYGDPGSGKSTIARSLSPDTFYYTPSNYFVTGYCDQKVGWLDDIDKETKGSCNMVIPLRLLTKMTDDGEAWVDPKGGAPVPWNARVVVITTNVPPSEWYPGASDVNRKAMLRRLRHVFKFEGTFDETPVKVTKMQRELFGYLSTDQTWTAPVGEAGAFVEHVKELCADALQ
jgi:hypothetical protein